MERRGVRRGFQTFNFQPAEPNLRFALTDARIDRMDDGARLVAGRLAVEVSADGLVRFTRAVDGAELVAEEAAHFWWPGPRLFAATGNGYHRIEQRFRAYDGERVLLIDHSG